MNAWQRRRNQNGWRDGLVEWKDGNTAYLSIVFSWHLDKAYQRAAMLKNEGYRVIAGGPAVALNPDALAPVAEIGTNINALPHHNPNATFTTRGCVRHCSFCAVPKIEGAMVELTDWEPKPIICDNNLLASSRDHFDSVIDRLKAANIQDVDFNQGLDARLLTPYHAGRLAELDLKYVRLAWDHTRLERQFMTAFEVLRDAGIPAQMIRVYVLLGYRDDPDDALYRLQTVKGLGAWPNPMRYQPLDARVKNSYIGENWTEYELKRFMRYWSNLWYLGNMPFEEFDLRRVKIDPVNEYQLAF
jgi:hypothetical protein